MSACGISAVSVHEEAAEAADLDAISICEYLHMARSSIGLRAAFKLPRFKVGKPRERKAVQISSAKTAAQSKYKAEQH